MPPQLLATLVGGGIGLAGVLRVFRPQRRASARDRFDQAVEQLLLRPIDELAGARDLILDLLVGRCCLAPGEVQAQDRLGNRSRPSELWSEGVQ